MFHKSNLGKFENEVEKFADFNGYVPEANTKFEEFCCDDLTEEETEHLQEEWQSFRAEAVEATARAEEKLAAFRS